MSSYLPSMLSSGLTSLFDSSTFNVGNALTSGIANMSSLAASAMNRGAQAAQARNYDLAVIEFKRAAAYSPGDPTPYNYIGQVYTMQGKLAEAIQAYRQALKIDPNNDPIRLNLAKAYVQNQDTGHAEKEYLQLAKTNPTNAELPTTLGYLYLNSGRLAEADTQFNRAIHIAPQSSTAYSNLGLVRNKQGNYEDAARLFEQALSLDPRNESAHENLAYAQLGLGDTTGAKTQYTELMSLNSSSAQQAAAKVDFAINTPKIYYYDVTKSDFKATLGQNTPLAALDTSLATPGASKVFKMTFVFNQKMNLGDVVNALNWSIGKADGTTPAGGVYNNGGYLSGVSQATIGPVPLSVAYDEKTNSATIYFKVTQNSTGDAVIDPSHWVFSFKGRDATGRLMDPKGNQWDGYAMGAF